MKNKIIPNIIKLPSEENSLPIDYERYLPKMTGLIHYEHLHRYMLAIQLAKGKKILDIACGEGYGCHILSQVAESVVGIDISEKTIKAAKLKYSRSNIEFIQSNAINIPLEDNSIDVVVSFETIEHLEEHDLFFQEIKRILKKDGIAVVSSPNKYVFSAINGMNNEFHISELTDDEFKSVSSKWFKNVYLMKQQVFGASHITGESCFNTPIYFEKNEYNEIMQHDKLENPLYCIAILSDRVTPEIHNSFYIDTVNKSNGIHYYQTEKSIYSNIIVELNKKLKTLSLDRENIINLKNAEISKSCNDYESVIKDLRQVISQKDAELSQKDKIIAEAAKNYDAKIAERDVVISQKDAELSQKDKIIAEAAKNYDAAIAERDVVISQKDAELFRLNIDKENSLLEKDLQLNDINKSICLNVITLKPVSIRRRIINRLNIRRKFNLKQDMALIDSSYLFDKSYYLEKYPDIKKAGIDPVYHYLVFGWRELRDPSLNFSTFKYLQDNPDVLAACINPLLHYLRNGYLEGRLLSNSEEFGAESETDNSKSLDSILPSSVKTDLIKMPTDSKEKKLEGNSPQRVVSEEEIEIVRNSALFNEKYYLNINKDLWGADIDLAKHYCEHGWCEGRDPSVLFDTKYYLEMNPDICNAGLNPLYHYIIAGEKEGRAPAMFHNIDYEDDCDFGEIETDIKPIAFYLPQFHEIKENNEWWGEGFTEWDNTRRTKPLLEGHYQPREPHEDLGYYDLSDYKTLKYQTELAKAHGIFGFCFYHYWFTGKRLLEKPVDMLLNHPEIKFPFCLCWANENWTRRWDGLDEHILIEQQYSESDDVAFIDDLKKYLIDERYIRIDGKPVILLYRPSLLPSAKETAERWRKRLRENGIGEIYLVCPYGAFNDMSSPYEYGFDAAIEFPPNILEPAKQNFQNILLHDGSTVSAYKYEQFVNDVLEKRKKEDGKNFELFYSVMLEWDNSPRRKDGATIFTNYSSLLYRNWLDETIERTRIEHCEDRRFIFINAWNEWAEGTYLEPDKRYGYLSLNETSRALCNIEPGRKFPKVSVIVPNYNHERYLPSRLDSIYNQTYKNIEVILLDDCSTDNSRKVLAEYAGKYPNITRCEFNEDNSGGVFRQWAKGISLAKGEFLWIAESDDYCDENFLDTLMKDFEDEAVLLAYSYCEFVDQEGQPLTEGGFEYYVNDIGPNKWISSYIETSHNEVRNALGFRNTIPNASGVVFKKPKDLKLLNDEEWLSMSVAGDWVFYLHIILGGKIAYNRSTSNYFRRYIGSAAESTYKRDVFYREVGFACRTIASLYDVPLNVLEKNREFYLDFYKSIVGQKTDRFEELFNYKAVLEERKKRKPVIMISLFAFYPGGAEIIPIRLANEFKRQGIPIILHSGKVMPRENKIRRMLRNDIPVIETGDISELQRAIEDFGIEVLNSHHWHIQRYPLQDPTVFSNLPTHIATLHGMIEADGGYGVTSEQLHLVDKYVNYWVYTAEKNIKPFKLAGLFGERPEKFIKIANGMASSDIVPVRRSDINIPENAFVICTVSRAIPEKGWKESIEVVTKVRALTGKDIRLILVGNGKVYDDYCRIGVPDFVYMPGFDENSAGYYAASDLGIMLTRFHSESFPLTILDCLSVGKPFISSDIGEIRTMLTCKDGIAGDVFELDDWTVPVDTVVNIIKEFILNENRYEAARNIVPKVAQRYTIKNVASEYLNIIRTNISNEKKQEKIIDSADRNDNTNPVKKMSFYETDIYREYDESDIKFHKESDGFCPICEERSTFISNHKWLRDNYRCIKCNSIPRWRYVQHVLCSLVPNWKDMIIHESSPCTDFIKRYADSYTASQFYPDKSPGEKVGEYTNENLEALTFSNNTFDVFITQDVLEHVYDPEKAVKEMLRVIKFGGYIIFTIPIFHGNKTLKRAQIDKSGNVEYLEDAVYHGNPVDSEGSLAVWDYGDDFIDSLKKWSGSNEVDVFNHPIPEMGIEGEFLDVFYIKKN